MVTIDEYKCPNCSGAVKFDSSARKMKCPYCEAEFEREALEEYRRRIAANSVDNDNTVWVVESDGEMWDISESDDLAAGACPSCGAELYGDKTTIAMVCPCCGNAQIVAKRIASMLKPDYIIPFKKDKSAVRKALTKFYRNKPLLPDTFTSENRIDCVQGVYAPFWLFDAEADGRAKYKAVDVIKDPSGNSKDDDTLYYTVEREGSLAFEKIPVDGSEKMNDCYMDSIEPFDYEDMLCFHPSYLAGYTAEKYDVDAETSRRRAELRIKKSVEDEFRCSLLGYETVETESFSVNVKNGKISYGLFPVWVLNTKYNDENYLFMMNGQTGKFVGWLPVDERKARAYQAKCAGIICAILTPLFFLLGIAVAYLSRIGLSAADGILPFVLIFIIALIVSLFIGAAGGSSLATDKKNKTNKKMLKSNKNRYVVPGSLRFTVKTDDLE